MAVTWIGGTPFTHLASATSISAAAPAGLQTDDLLIAFVFHRSTLTPPAGWSLIDTTGGFSNAVTQYVSAYRKNMVVPADAGSQFSWVQATANRIGLTYASIRGGRIAQNANSTVNNQTTYNIDSPQLTADADGDLVLMAASSIVSSASDTELIYPLAPAGSQLWSGAGAPQYRLAGAYTALNAGEKNNGLWNLRPNVEPISNGMGAISIRITQHQKCLIQATTPLGSASVRGSAPSAGTASASTPLGAASAVGIFGNLARGTGWASTPLGQSSAHGQHSAAAWVTVSSPLGAAQSIGQHTTVARAQATTPLGMSQALGRYPIIGFAQATSPLGAASAVLYHDFSSVPDVANATIFYTCQLVDQGAVLATVPMSSWQATLQVDRANYAQAVFPAIGPVADVLASLPATSEFVILRGVKLPDGASVQQEMARAPCQTLQFDRGPYNHTCTVRGYMPAPPIGVFSGECRTMQGIRSISTGPSGIRARCSVDWFLRPGQGAMIDGRETAIGMIGYYISTQDEYMDVSEALNG